MVYPSALRPGQYGLPDPQAVPGTTVGYALSDFNARCEGRSAELVPWLQDFTMGRHVHARQISRTRSGRAQRFARHQARSGYLLWNAGGIYTPGSSRRPRRTPERGRSSGDTD